MYDFVARPYSPALGRFLAPDSIIPEPGNPQALNRYAFTLNNPVKYTDPDGHSPAVVAALAAIGPVGWVALGVGAGAGALYLSYQLLWAPNAADNREAAANVLNNIATNISEMPETFMEKTMSSPEGLGATLAVITAKGAISSDSSPLNAKPNTEGNRGVKEAYKAQASQHGKLPPDKEPLPVPPYSPPQKQPQIDIPSVGSATELGPEEGWLVALPCR